MQQLSSRLAAFIRHESAAGLLLVVCALLALSLDNSPLSWAYDGLLALPMTVRIGALAIDKPLLLWINDGLMAIFFFLVGLEIKREFLEGELAGRDRALLPAIAALGGMVVPALVYIAITAGKAEVIRGWAIASATDIAFAMAVLSLLGSRIPPALRAFLLALAIIDDLGAIIIIALFYTGSLSWLSLGLAGICVAILVGLNRAGVDRPATYLLAGLVMWVCVLKSGVHATLAGVITALAIPLTRSSGAEPDQPAMLHRLEEALHPWVAYGILPLFAFANSGVSLEGFGFAMLAQPVTLGIALGLFVGKQIGVFGATWLSVKLGIAHIPEGANWLQVWGVALVAGIGFTMSLFIGTLAFPDGGQATAVRLGVIAGSIASAIAGYAVLRLAAERQ